MTWKTIAIICMIIIVAETGFIYWAWDWGIQDIENENECIINVCGNYDSYYYYDGLCECYSDGELKKERYIN